eukprot:8668815-Lingulodinium_polyedra.AAC.1
MSRVGPRLSDSRPLRHWAVRCIWSCLGRHELPPLFSTRWYRHGVEGDLVKQVTPVVNPCPWLLRCP